MNTLIWSIHLFLLVLTLICVARSIEGRNWPAFCGWTVASLSTLQIILLRSV